MDTWGGHISGCIMHSQLKKLIGGVHKVGPGTSDAYDDTDAGGLEGLPGLAVTSRTTCPSCPFVLHSGSCKVARMARQDPSETHDFLRCISLALHGPMGII